MKRHSLLSTRVVFVVITIITLALLAGSVLLQRIVFKADQVSAAVLLSPTSLQLPPENTGSLKIQADFASPLPVVAAQFGFSVDAAIAQLVSIQAADGWQTKKFVSSNGSTHWLVVPASERGTVVTLNGLTTFGTVTINSHALGTTALHFLSADTIISAIDPNQGSLVYNAVSTVQDAALTINTKASPPATVVPGSGLTIEDQSAASSAGVGSLQRVVASSVFAFPNSATLFISLRYQATVAVEFGETPALGNNIETIEPATDQVVRLNGLKDQTRYYYRVTARTAERSSRIIGNTHSFETKSASQAQPDPSQSELKIVPRLSRDSATAYIMVRDQNGQVVVDQTPTITVVGGQATLATTTSVNGHYQFLIHSELSRRQVVRVRASVNGQMVSEQSVTFDPNYVEAKMLSTNEAPVLPLSNELTILITALSAVAILLSLLFIRLARLK